MKKILTLIFCAAAILIVSPAALAAPSVYGPTGMISNPSADVLREGQFSLGYFHFQDQTSGTFEVNLADGLEMGAARIHNDHYGTDTLFNAKYSLLPETLMSPGVAVGAESGFNGGHHSLYAAASKSLPFGLRLHVGAGNGRFDGAFAGLEKTWKPIGSLSGGNVFPATTLMVEFDGRRMNYGARIAVLPGLKVDAGWQDHRFYTGITFTK